MSGHNGNPPLTDWFPGNVKPVRKGWYQREYRSSQNATNDWWSGKQWKYQPHDESGALNQERRWRGLSAPAKESE